LRQAYAELSCGPEIDDQLELRGLLDREISGLGAPEDLVDVGRAAPPLIGEAGRVRFPSRAVSGAFISILLSSNEWVKLSL
jgi:hypothetical protein